MKIAYDHMDPRCIAGRNAKQEGRPRVAPYSEDLDRRRWEAAYDSAARIVMQVADPDVEISEDSAMDARKYPSYTLADLERFVAEGKGNAVMIQEIADRKSGASQTKVTPQIIGGKAQVKVGRM
jgi:hypothetical protein